MLKTLVNVDHCSLERANGAAVLSTTNRYDLLNRLLETSSDRNRFDYQYNQANQRTNMALADGSQWKYQYDDLGQVTEGKKSWPDASLVAGQQFEYDYDDIGNRLSAKAGGDGAGLNLRSASYTNNGVNQITSRTVPGAIDIVGVADARSKVKVNGTTAHRHGEYFRDELPIDNSGANAYLAVTNESILLSHQTNSVGLAVLDKTPQQFAYGADENLTNDGRWVLEWDAENRLKSMCSVSTVPNVCKRRLDFVYDWIGRRIAKIESSFDGTIYLAARTNKFVYDGWNLLAELNATNGLIHSYVWGLDLGGSMQGAGGVGGLISMTDYTGVAATNYFYGFDGNGNVAKLVNATDSSIAAEYDYGPFGEMIRATGPMANSNPFRFSTKYTDDETDLVYYGYRYYNPSTGRWLSRDPIEEQGGLNLYGFLRNDGVNSVDRFGLYSTRVLLRAYDAEMLVWADFNGIECDVHWRWIKELSSKSKIPCLDLVLSTIVGVKSSIERTSVSMIPGPRFYSSKPCECDSIGWELNIDIEIKTEWNVVTTASSILGVGLLEMGLAKLGVGAGLAGKVAAGAAEDMVTLEKVSWDGYRDFGIFYKKMNYEDTSDATRNQAQ